MKKTSLTILLSLFLCKCLISQPETQKMDSLVKLFKEKKCFNGEILVTVSGETFYHTTCGFRDAESREEILPNSVFNLGSVSKTFTAVAIFQLQEKGWLNIDDKVVKYLPQFPYDEIKIKHLLSHTSGLRQDLDQIEDFEMTTSVNNDSLISILSRYKPSLYCTPGNEWIYSNIGYEILALVVESVAKQKFRDYLNDKVFKPAGMKRSFIPGSKDILQWLPAEVNPKEMLIPNNFKSIHSCEVTSVDSVPFQSARMDFLTGSENVYSCTGDLEKFDHALRNNVILSDESQKLAYAPYVLANGDTAKDLNAPIPSYYGMGWFISIDTNYGRIIWHKGRSIGSRSVFLRNPGKQQVVTATDNFDYTAVDLKGIAFLKILNHKPYRNPVLMSMIQKLGCGIYSKGFEDALYDFRELKSKERADYYISEEEVIQLKNDLVNDHREKDALLLIEYSRELFPSSPAIMTDYAGLLLLEGRNKEAEAEYRKAVQLAGSTEEEREVILNTEGYRFLLSNQLDKAEFVLKLNTELFPESANTFDSYASVLEKNQKHELAIRMQKKAVKLAEKSNDKLLETFKENLKKLEE